MYRELGADSNITPKVSGWPKASPLDCTVRPEGQKEAPKLDDGRNPRKTAAPPKRRSAARTIAASADCASASGQKRLKLAQRMQAKPARAPKPTAKTARERRHPGVNGGLHKAEYEGTNAALTGATPNGGASG